MTVFLGRNGTGKTNLFEALILIFRDADLNRTPTFPFALSYASRGQEIELTGRPDARSGRFTVKVDGKRLNQREFRSQADRFLPDHLFTYYSGPSNRLNQHFESHEARYLAALLQGEPRALRRLFYARSVHSQ